LWFGVDDAASSCYMPMFCGITNIPEQLREGNGSMVDYSPTAAFWIFTKVSNFAYSRYSDMIVHIREKQRTFEQKFVKEIQDMEKEMVELFKNDPEKAQRRINQYSSQAAYDVCKAWDDLFIYLLVKYNDGNVKKEENGKFLKTDGVVPHVVSPQHPRYPDHWYEMIIQDCGKNIEYKNNRLELENYRFD